MKVRTLLCVSLVFVGCGRLTGSGAQSLSTVKEQWNVVNDPAQLPGAFERHLDKLPTSGSVDKKPWSDTYWPSFQGGIANRWHGDRTGFDYKSPTLDAAKKMSLADLSELSPAEKYDIFIGRFDYALVKFEQARTSPDRPQWEGLCHGWSNAAFNFAEPHAVLAEGANGIKVPFGASDVKALLTLFQGNLGAANAYMLGARCNIDIQQNPNAQTRPECRDVNAGAFHIILTNYLGLMHKGFVADVTRDEQVWNQPVFAFSTKKLRDQAPTAGAAPGTVKEVVMQTSMAYALEVGANWYDWSASKSDVYTYRLELNKDGEIIGGDWEEYARPDFLWFKEAPVFDGYMAQLRGIYEQATANTTLPDPDQ